MTCYDVFNGDADGICALQQLRLREPREAELVTGMKRDMDRAAYWAFRAAYGGYPGAMEFIGDIYAEGHWVVTDRRLAAAWYRRAARRGHESAANKLKELQARARQNKP